MAQKVGPGISVGLDVSVPNMTAQGATGEDADRGWLIQQGTDEAGRSLEDEQTRRGTYST